MTRLFLEEKITEGTAVGLDKEMSHYVSSVLRMRTGETLVIVDGRGMECEGQIESAVKDSVTVRISQVRKCVSEPPLKITLYQSVSKGERMDLTIQKAVELGVYRVVPVFSERCIVKPDKKASRSDRWQKIALEAARQCGRGIVPEVSESLMFDEALKDAGKNCDAVIMPWEEENGCTIKQFLKDRAGDAPAAVGVFIGPEGGFCETEAAKASKAGAVSVTLGKRILRTETAGPAVLAMILYEFEL